MDAFTQAYITAALWSSHDDADEYLDANYTVSDLAPETIIQMSADCAAFCADNAALLEGLDSEQAGHDFWLTRNGHGAGFWDRGLGDIGLRLTEAAKAYGERGLYVGDDGRIYCA